MDNRLKQVEETLEAAEQFIRNGIKFHYIRMPDKSTPDSAHKTPEIIPQALALLRSLDGKVLVDEERLVFLAELTAHLFDLIEQNEENNKAKDKAQQLFKLLLAEVYLAKEDSDG